MEDIVNRMGRVESPLLGIHAQLADVRGDVAALKATVPHLATKCDIGDLRALVASTESSLIKWIVGTAVSCAAVAFAAARLIP